MSNPNLPGEFDAQDEFKVLRDLWKSEQPTIERGDELENEDARTRAAIEQLQSAWSEALAPVSSEQSTRDREQFIREAKRRLRPRQTLPARQWIALAAAAVLLFAVALRLQTDIGEPNQETTEIALHIPNESNSEATVAPSSEVTSIHRAPDEVQVDFDEDNRMILRSGPVRLYLPTASLATGNANSNSLNNNLEIQSR
ncbi:MAG: hypothetical protein ACI8TQ_001485 [Planctomycetota bacterium]|jgi:hypothetical protein